MAIDILLGCQKLFLFLQKTPKETSVSDKEFLLKCSIGTENEFENLNNRSWIIINKHQNDIELKNAELNTKKSENDFNNNIFLNSLNMLAYNNNILDKMILVHAYQQKFGEVFKNITYKNKLDINSLYIL